MSIRQNDTSELRRAIRRSRAAAALGALAWLPRWLGAGIPVRGFADARAVYKAARTADGQPDLSGIWQTMNTANWDIEEHGAAPAPYADLVGVYLAQPAGLSVVEGGTIPYKPEALEKRNRYRAERLHPDPLVLENGTEDRADPEAKCFQGGVPRVTYMPYPFQILQNKDTVLIAYTSTAEIRRG